MQDNLLAIGSFGKPIQIKNMENDTIVREIHEEVDAICIMFHQNRLIVGGEYKTSIWDYRIGEQNNRIESKTLGKCRNFDLR